MKILLVQPHTPASTISTDVVYLLEPLGLEYVAAGVDRKHQVEILDTRIEPAFAETLRSYKPDIVGITAYTLHVNVAKQILRQAKEWNREVVTVVGGHHATVAPEDFFEPQVDIVVIGDGVFAFRDVVRRLESKQTLEEVAGIAFNRNAREFVRTPVPPHPDLDSLPFPRRDLTRRFSKRYAIDWMRPIGSIRTSKGCPFRCDFCALWKLTGGKYLKRDPAKVVEELKGMEEEYIFFSDDESFVDAKRMSELADLIEKEGISKKYFLYARTDSIVRHRDLLRKWKQIGLQRLLVGIEFLNDADLASINKGSSCAQSEEAIQIVNQLGLEVFASFIVRQDFDRNDFRRLREYCRNLKSGYPVFTVLTPLPGTKLYDDLKDRITTTNYDHFDFFHTVLPTRLPLREFYKELFHLYLRSQSLLKIFAMLRKLPLSEIPGLVFRLGRRFKRLRTLYRDYDELPDFEMRGKPALKKSA